MLANKPQKTVIFFILFSLIVGLDARVAHAGLLENIKNAIQNQTGKLQNIDSEIREIEGKRDEVRVERQTLESAVRDLTNAENKLESEVVAAQNGVAETESKIGTLQEEIEVQEALIEKNSEGVAEAIRTISKNDDNTMVELLLTNGNLSDFWSRVDMLQKFNESVVGRINNLSELRESLKSRVFDEQQAQAALIALYGEIEGKQRAAEYARAEKARLLGAARGEEQGYEATLAEKRELKSQFEQTLNAFEAQLQIALNPATIPVAQDSTLLYPVDNVVITQNFGYTAFAASGAYGGNGHNGTDFGVPVGSNIKAARAGIVKGTGNTDLACPNASFGQWIFVEHDNGLSTMYAHLSSISVSPGQSVTGGQVIGYSGNTGYSTGPHLHFGVYATDGAEIRSFPSNGCAGAVYTMPVANPEAYLDAAQYLP